MLDSQADSQHRELERTTANGSRLCLADFHLERTAVDAGGQQKRALQNRLRGAVEASWVGSIPIHPRQRSRFMTAKVTVAVVSRNIDDRVPRLYSGHERMRLDWSNLAELGARGSAR